MMVLTCHISCISNNFSSYCVSFSLMMSLTVMVLGPGHPVCVHFYFPLEIELVVSVAEDLAFLFQLESS